MNVEIKDLAVLENAIQHYGIAHQIMQCIQECAELADALTRLRMAEMRGKDISKECCDAVEEVADVMIMAAQMAELFGEENVQEIIDFKLDRLQKRMDSESAEIKSVRKTE